MQRPLPAPFALPTLARAGLIVMFSALILLVSSVAQAGPASDADQVVAFHPRPLPVALQAHLPHTPQPFPGEGDLEFERQGPSGWVLVAAVLGSGAAVSGLVALASQARLGSADTQPADVPKLKRTRNDAGYVALGLAGGAGVALIIHVAK